MGKIIGIDLGSSNSCVSVIEGSNSVVISNAEGRRTTPSIVGIKDGEIKVGDSAKRQAVTNPKNTIYTIKRLMGKDFKDVKDMNLPYKVVDNKGRAAVEIDGKVYNPEEISAMILQKLKKEAEDYLGEEVTSAVITVPAYFNDAERNATKVAGEIAGLKVERIINEPTAASLSYGMDKKDDDINIAVFDFGGSTFDVSYLTIADGVNEVLSTDGDVYLGGDDCDNEITNWLIDEFKDEYGADLSKDPMALQRLKEAAEKAKIELSSTTSTEINLPYIMPIDGVPKHLVRTLTKAKFEQMISSIVERTIEPCKKALKESGLKIEDIDEVILVGGSTRIPAIQEAVEKFFGKAPNKSVNPDEAVALGAAVQGGVLSGDVTDVLLLDVIPISMGIETMGGVFTKLIDANTTIPVRKTEVFSTASDNQPSVEIHVCQGERAMASDNMSLGKFHLDGIPPSPRGIPQIEVAFDIDSNGILTVTATDKATGKVNNIRIEGGGKLSDDEIERMKMEAQQNADNDRKRKEEVEIINQADSLIFQTTKQLEEFKDKLSDSNRDNINNALDKLKMSFNDKNVDNIKVDIETLNSAWQQASTEMYNETSNATTETSEESNSSSSNTEAEDVDFEEVK